MEHSFLFPLPHLLDERITTEIMPGLARLIQPLHHHGPCQDTSMVESRYEQRRLTVHSIPLDQTVLDRHGEGVANMQRTSDTQRG